MAATMKHFETYAKAAAGGRDSFAAYLDDYVYGVGDHFEYLEKVGLKSLLKLRKLDIAL